MQSRESAENTATQPTDPRNCYISQQERKPGFTIRFPCGCLFTGMVGALAAFSMSWVFNHSWPWAIVHTVLNWLYVFYKAAWYVVNNF